MAVKIGKMSSAIQKAHRSDETLQDINKLEGYDIVCYAKDWVEDPTSCNHVLMELSKANRILWLNSISTRTPNLSNKRDISKIWRKIRELFTGPIKKQNNLWVYTPFVIPLHANKIVVGINRVLLRLSVRWVLYSLGMKCSMLWTWVPTSAQYLNLFGENVLIYYCTDEWTQFKTSNPNQIRNYMEILTKESDVVFATSQPLVGKLIPFNQHTYLASHGVDYELFSSALKENILIPNDISCLSEPIIGYYGLVENWIDLDLIEFLASRHSDWNIVLIGKIMIDVSQLSSYSNIYFIGRKLHSELPLYCSQFSVGLIPHKVNELTRHMNPIKLREYLSAGVPVVSTALPEVKRCSALCCVANDYIEFEKGVIDYINNDNCEARYLRSIEMSTQTWGNQVALLSNIVMTNTHTKLMRR